MLHGRPDIAGDALTVLDVVGDVPAVDLVLHRRTGVEADALDLYHARSAVHLTGRFGLL